MIDHNMGDAIKSSLAARSENSQTALDALQTDVLSEREKSQSNLFIQDLDERLVAARDVMHVPPLSVGKGAAERASNAADLSNPLPHSNPEMTFGLSESGHRPVPAATGVFGESGRMPAVVDKPGDWYPGNIVPTHLYGESGADSRDRGFTTLAIGEEGSGPKPFPWKFPIELPTKEVHAPSESPWHPPLKTSTMAVGEEGLARKPLY